MERCRVTGDGCPKPRHSSSLTLLSPSGLLLLDKPSGPTSHDLVNLIRRGTGIRRVGHTGTLDPLASGLLIVLVGAATRLSEYLVGADKRYHAVVRFGSATDTYDAQGRVTRESPVTFDAAELRSALQPLRGEIQQTPPQFSALKLKGRPAYARARAGEEVSLTPRRVTIYSLELLQWSPPFAALDVHCSSGTYIRSLANDLGLALASAAHLVELRRTQTGPFAIGQAISPDQLRSAFADGLWAGLLRPAAEALPDMPALWVTPAEAQMLARGMRVERSGVSADSTTPGQLARAVTLDGQLAAIVEWLDSAQAYQPRKVFLESEPDRR